MPSVSEKTTIPASIEDVWPLLRDPALVASCIPGATLAADQSDGVWRGGIRVKFGPTVAVFKGEATLTYDDALHTCSIEGRGIDGRGASRALASGRVTASGSHTTELAIDGTFSVSGPLETFANAGGVHVARALLSEFSGNLTKLIAERRAAGASAAMQSSPLAKAAVAASEEAAPAAAAHVALAPAAVVGEPPPRPDAAPPKPVAVEATGARARVQIVRPREASARSETAPLEPTHAPSRQHAPVEPAKAAPHPSPAPAAEISALRILWLALQSWFRDLFAKRK